MHTVRCVTELIVENGCVGSGGTITEVAHHDDVAPFVGDRLPALMRQP